MRKPMAAMTAQQPLTSDEIASVYDARNGGPRARELASRDVFDWVSRQAHLVRVEGDQLFAKPKLWIIRFQYRLKYRHRLNAVQVSEIMDADGAEIHLDLSPEECADNAAKEFERANHRRP